MFVHRISRYLRHAHGEIWSLARRSRSCGTRTQATARVTRSSTLRASRRQTWPSRLWMASTCVTERLRYRSHSRRTRRERDMAQPLVSWSGAWVIDESSPLNPVLCRGDIFFANVSRLLHFSLRVSLPGFSWAFLFSLVDSMAALLWLYSIEVLQVNDQSNSVFFVSFLFLLAGNLYWSAKCCCLCMAISHLWFCSGICLWRSVS